MALIIRFITIAGLQLTGLLVAESWILLECIACLLAIFVVFNVRRATSPTNKGKDGALCIGDGTSFDLIFSVGRATLINVYN